MDTIRRKIKFLVVDWTGYNRDFLKKNNKYSLSKISIEMNGNNDYSPSKISIQMNENNEYSPSNIPIQIPCIFSDRIFPVFFGKFPFISMEVLEIVFFIYLGAVQSRFS